MKWKRSRVPNAQLFGESHSGAIFSPCERYRYRLWREWDTTKDGCCFVMLNPSTATETLNDPTIRRCIEFSKRWGYGRVEIVNLFGLRSTDPRGLREVADPVGPDNIKAIVDAVKISERAILAWGRHGAYLERGPDMMEKMEIFYPTKGYALMMNGDGSPRHPLYVSYSVEPIKL